jgi:hypothetical protein
MGQKFATQRATKVAAGGFPVGGGCRRAIELVTKASHGVTMQTSFLAASSICSMA